MSNNCYAFLANLLVICSTCAKDVTIKVGTLTEPVNVLAVWGDVKNPTAQQSVTITDLTVGKEHTIKAQDNAAIVAIYVTGKSEGYTNFHQVTNGYWQRPMKWEISGGNGQFTAKEK